MKNKTIVILFSFFILFASCANDDEETDPPETLEPGPRNRVIRLFEKPFSGDPPCGAPFDHDLPIIFEEVEDENDYILTWQGYPMDWGWDGHKGHDWVMPEGTPIYSVADGEVVFAGREPPFICGNRGPVSALIVKVRHIVPDELLDPNDERNLGMVDLSAEVFDSLYIHLSRVDVVEGDYVYSGQQIGLSGNTGCSSGPHLHLEIHRLHHTNDGEPTAVDPFGWEGWDNDPWANHPEGAQSFWLWKKGEAPLCPLYY